MCVAEYTAPQLWKSISHGYSDEARDGRPGFESRRRRGSAGERRHAGARDDSAIHDDARCAVQSAVAHRVLPGWEDAHHREARRALARHAGGSQNEGGERAGVLLSGRAECSACTCHRSTTPTNVYLTYSEPGDSGSSLALARARLAIADTTASLEGLQVIWRDGARGRGGQFGAAVAFSPDKQFLFLTVGERQRMTPAQDPNSPLGKILRLTLDGKPAPGNPQAGKTGTPTLDIINPPRNTEIAKTAPTVYTYTFPGPNLTPSETWTSGHRTPYGLAFAPDGRLWELEHGPRGGDELNLIEPGKNYGWPLVSYATNYDGVADSQSGYAVRPGQAGHLLDTRDRAREHDVLSGQGVPAVERVAPHQRPRLADAQPRCVRQQRGRNGGRAVERRIPGPRCGRRAGWRCVADREQRDWWIVPSHAEVARLRQA